MLKDFSWEIFEKSGSVEAYLLYNQVKGNVENVRELSFFDNLLAIQEVSISNQCPLTEFT